MAVGTDKVQVLKRESSALGGNPADDVDYPTPINPQTDALEAAGVFLQDSLNRDTAVYIARAGDDLVLRDINNTTPVTLTSLVSGTPTVDRAFRRHFLFMGG